MRFLLDFSDMKTVFKITTKMKEKNNLHTKITLKGISKRNLHSYKTLKNSIKIWKKFNFLSRIPQLGLTHFGNFEAYYFSIFHFC